METWLLQQLENGDDAEHALAFVSVDSEVYPQLGAYYEARMRAFVQDWVEENREEEPGEDEEAVDADDAVDDAGDDEGDSRS